MNDAPPTRGQPGRRVLLTGFEPFGGHASNVSEKVARALAASPCELPVPRAFAPNPEASVIRVEWTARVLSVDHEGARFVGSQSPRWLEQFDAIIHLGLAESARRVRLEGIARNALDMKIPDNAGRRVQGGRVLWPAPEQYSSTVDIPTIARGIGSHLVETSSDAGRYVCNETYFLTLHTIIAHNLCAPGGRLLPAIFLHLPPAEVLGLSNAMFAVGLATASVLAQSPLPFAPGQ